MIKVIDEHLVRPINYKKYAKKVANIENSEQYAKLEKVTNLVSENELKEIEKYAENVRKNYDILVVCGIGGSYLGARAAIEALNGLRNENKPKIIFAGQTFSSNYTADILNEVKGKKFAINVVSKSGSTTETSIAFRLLRTQMEKEHGKEYAKKAIFVTTDPENGILREIANKEGYVSFTLPHTVGGRYSVLSPVGLFPMACAGINVRNMLKGALNSEKAYQNPHIFENEAFKYAAIRYDQYKHGKKVEMLVSYEPSLVQLGEWHKQLFAESEGKENKGLLPASLTFSTDLHSLGQFIQQGSQIFFETILHFERSNKEVVVPEDKDDLDKLNYLKNKDLDFVQQKAFEGVLKAHSEEAKVPNVVINITKLDEETLGELFYFFEKAAVMSSHLLGVNPFNQPGVEVYKKNMFKLLGKKS